MEAGHIRRAYLEGNRNDQRRIEIYGQMERERLAASIVPFRNTDAFPGRAVLLGCWRESYGTKSVPYLDGKDPEVLKEKRSHKRDRAKKSSYTPAETPASSPFRQTLCAILPLACLEPCL